MMMMMVACSSTLICVIFLGLALVAVNALPQSVARLRYPYPGTLLNVTFRGEVGTLLPSKEDKLTNATLSAIMDGLTQSPQSYWLLKAQAQIRLTLHRQVYRESRGQLTLPPEPVWNITIDPDLRGYRILSQAGRNFLTAQYEFHSVVIARRGSVHHAEPVLANMFGSHVDTWMVPMDPDYMFQRTGYSCIDESHAPLTEVTSDNFWNFYDDTCVPASQVVPGSRNCHTKHDSPVSCLEAITTASGSVKLDIRWTRIPYEVAVADQFRVGNPESEGTRNLENKPFNTYRIVYRYFRRDDCLYRDNRCVRGFGWRRLLTFTTTVINVSKQRYLNIARLYDNGNTTIFVEKGIYKWDTCINDFKHVSFAEYNLDARRMNSPIVTCIHDSYRYQNHEYSPMTTQYNTCKWQGISSGWGFDLTAGTSCQWLDVTRQIKNRTRELTSTINPSGYICEGVPALTETPKRPIFPPIEMGPSISSVRPICNYTEDYMADNNFQTNIVPYLRATVVTRRCPFAQRQHGLLRDCGWRVLHEARECKAGALTTISVFHNGTSTPSLAVRICDVSRRLGLISMRCEYIDSLANSVAIPGASTEITFICPTMRDDVETGGLYSVMVTKYAPWESKRRIGPIVVEDVPV